MYFNRQIFDALKYLMCAMCNHCNNKFNNSKTGNINNTIKLNNNNFKYRTNRHVESAYRII